MNMPGTLTGRRAGENAKTVAIEKDPRSCGLRSGAVVHRRPAQPVDRS